MRHNPGRLLLLFVALLSLLRAEDFRFDARVDVPDPYVKEAVLLQVDLNQTNHDIVLLFNFDLKPSPDYTFWRIDSKETDSYHDAKVHYLYLVYPLKSGRVEIDFELVKRVTNDESVAYSFSGDRDNVKILETKNTNVTLPPLTLDVKPLPEGTQLVGDFTLAYDLKQTRAKAYEPIPFQVTITGRGYLPLLEGLVPQSPDFTLFSEKPIVHTSHSKEGTHSKVIYPMALSAKEDFTLPAVKIKAFDPKKERSYLLEVPQTTFSIERPDVNTLVDKVDNPPPYEGDWGWLRTLLGYLIVFGAGFASGWLFRWQRRTRHEHTHPLMEKIEACKEKRALLQLLLAHDAARFAKVIDKLEADLYGKGSYTLKSLKREAKEQLQW
jgi:hypothetical protein